MVLKEDPISVENVANQKEVTAFAHMIITQVKINWDLYLFVFLYFLNFGYHFNGKIRFFPVV